MTYLNPPVDRAGYDARCRALQDVDGILKTIDYLRKATALGLSQYLPLDDADYALEKCQEALVENRKRLAGEIEDWERPVRRTLSVVTGE